ncbi:hypothetical protein EHQ52_15430 [Leptospira koniambonensis]|uniref:Uncharacterized protein n=1 Tax=Leptospira koniambonensis TaxID=2484950 RepID=A0A4R9J590_9LEPT|nr:hypothetical protein [Leptospira koniambonensis]TGL31327.1 hypothetical protein EHQ52_15430 [Leptospira koniambonensis]
MKLTSLLAITFLITCASGELKKSNYSKLELEDICKFAKSDNEGVYKKLIIFKTQIRKYPEDLSHSGIIDSAVLSEIFEEGENLPTAEIRQFYDEDACLKYSFLFFRKDVIAKFQKIDIGTKVHISAKFGVISRSKDITKKPTVAILIENVELILRGN